MKYNTTIGSQLSGSIGGITGSHNGMGYYFRRKTIPVNPNSSGQVVVRNYFATLAALWQALTQAQRDSYIVYAQNVPVTDKLGATINLTGLNWYQAVNVLRLQASLTRVDTMSATFSLCPLTAPSATIAAAGGTFPVTFVNNLTTDPWANFVGGALAVFMSAPYAPTRISQPKSYRFVGKVVGAVVPPTSPQNFTKAYAVSPGQRVGFKFVALAADGRISSPIRTTAIVT